MITIEFLVDAQLTTDQKNQIKKISNDIRIRKTKILNKFCLTIPEISVMCGIYKIIPTMKFENIEEISL